MHIESVPQIVSLLALVAAAFGWGVTMNRKQDKANCAKYNDSLNIRLNESNDKLYSLMRDLTTQLSEMKVEIAKLNGKIESLEKQVDVLNKMEAILERNK